MQGSAFELLTESAIWLRLLGGLWVTLQVSLVSVALSLPLGIVLGMLMTMKNRAVLAVTAVLLEFVRIMPQLALLFVVFFGFTRSFGWNLDAFWSAVIVFTFWGAVETGDLVRGAVTSIPKTQYESARVLGFTPAETLRFIVIPQALRRLLPPVINLVTRMIKTTSLVALIGMVEVLKVGQQIIDASRFQYPTAALWIYGAVFLLYFLACWPISLAARALERRWEADRR